MNGNVNNMQYGAYNTGLQQPAIKPSGFWYIIAAGFLIAGIVIGTMLFVDFGKTFLTLSESMHEFQSPNTIEVSFDQAGKYYIYYMQQPNIANAQTPNQTFTAVVQGTKKPLALIKVPKSNYHSELEINGQTYLPMYSFMLDGPTTAMVTALPFGNKDMVGVFNNRFAVGPALDVEDIMSMLGIVFGGIGALVGGFILALIIFLITIIRRSNCKKRVAQMAYTAQMQQPQYAPPGQVPPPPAQQQPPQNYPPTPPMT